MILRSHNEAILVTSCAVPNPGNANGTVSGASDISGSSGGGGGATVVLQGQGDTFFLRFVVHFQS